MFKHGKTCTSNVEMGREMGMEKEKEMGRESVQPPPSSLSAHEQKLTPIQYIISIYKAALDVPAEDTRWDKRMFKRYVRDAESILEAFCGDVRYAADFCMNKMADLCERAKKNTALHWTLRMVADDAWDKRGEYLQYREKKNYADTNNRKALDDNTIPDRDGSAGFTQMGASGSPSLDAIRKAGGDKPVDAAKG